MRGFPGSSRPRLWKLARQRGTGAPERRLCPIHNPANHLDFLLPLDQTRGQWLAEPVGRIMTEDPITVAAETPVTVAARVLLETKIDAVPVREGGEIVGIFITIDAREALLVLLERSGG